MTEPTPPVIPDSSTPIDLDKLEAVAQAADFEWELAKRGLSNEDGPQFREYAKAAKPAVVLQLLSDLREARRYMSVLIRQKQCTQCLAARPSPPEAP